MRLHRASCAVASVVMALSVLWVAFAYVVNKHFNDGSFDYLWRIVS